MYDITSSDSFDRMKQWHEELKEKLGDGILILLLGNKIDNETLREVV